MIKYLGTFKILDRYKYIIYENDKKKKLKNKIIYDEYNNYYK